MTPIELLQEAALVHRLLAVATGGRMHPGRGRVAIGAAAGRDGAMTVLGPSQGCEDLDRPVSGTR